MFQSSDNLSGSPSFTTRVTRQEDGTYKAECVSLPQVPAIVKGTEAEAMIAMRSALERFVTSNGTRT